MLYSISCLMGSLTRSTQPCIFPGSLNRVPASAGGKGGNVTSAGWQVSLCDPMWHVSSRSGVATLRIATHLLLAYLLTLNILASGPLTNRGSSAGAKCPVHAYVETTSWRAWLISTADRTEHSITNAAMLTDELRSDTPHPRGILHPLCLRPDDNRL